MLNIKVSRSAEAAKRYHKESLTMGDYYLEGLEVARPACGKAAEMLGLDKQIDKNTYDGLLDNRLPDGQKLTARDNPKRRCGYDFTFDVPKSVSVLYGITGDEKIVAAMEKAVDATMREIEQDMHCRVRKHGAFHDRKTGNMLWIPYGDFD